MKRVLTILLAAACFTVPAFPQTGMTNMVASHMESNLTGQLLTGKLCLTPTLKDHATGFSANGAAQVVPVQTCYPVAAGVLDISVPDTALANPSVGYKAVVEQQNGLPLYTYSQLLFPTGATWNLDAWAPTQSANITTPTLQLSTSTPTGDCGSAIAIDVAGTIQTGLTLYACDEHTWNLISGSGSGSVGPQGPKGDTGAQGPQGIQGATGATGPQGVKGDTGDTGPQGVAGPQGDPGSTGATGATGPKGDTGDAGAQGIQGVKGDKGDQGDVGPAGPTGPTGATGATGPKGDPGDGEGDGTAATIAVGTVTSGDTASVTNSGTDSAAIFDFVLPKGDTGATGPKGDTGDAGPTGATGATGSDGGQGVKGDTGDAGATGPTGPKGDPGDTGSTGATGSAATISVGTVSSGDTASVTNSGSSSAAVFDIVLPKGDTGATGPTGPTGADGAKGDKGDQGDAGATGATGSTGTAGADGKTVLHGSGAPTSGTGADGDTYIDDTAHVLYGPKASGAWPSGVSLIGPKGDTGDAGATGATGAAGAKGDTGDTGATGTAGTNGNTVLHGTGAPSSGTGSNGDFYIDTAASVIYGPKASGSWPGSGTPLVGATGATGSTGATGATGSAGASAIYTSNGVALPTGSISANTCTAATGSPFTASGVATNNLAMFGWASDPSAVSGYGSTGGLSVRIIPGANTVAVKICNPNSTSVTAGTMSINVRVYP